VQGDERHSHGVLSDEPDTIHDRGVIWNYAQAVDLDLIDAKEVAAILNVTVNNFNVMKHRGSPQLTGFPKPKRRFGNSDVWDRKEVEDWAKANWK
jgi:predicted DNA-binding transcriptional regulator AlpA